MNAVVNTVASKLLQTVNDCADMIDSAAVELTPNGSMPPVAEPLPSLLEQCRTLTDSNPTEPEPIRTIHHFACTGGTLISKCLACMPNTQLLSEVEPFSRMQEMSQSRFHPTDFIRLIRHSSRGGDNQLEAKIFLLGLKFSGRIAQTRACGWSFATTRTANTVSARPLLTRPLCESLSKASFQNEPSLPSGTRTIHY